MVKKIAIFVGQLMLALGVSWGAARACFLPVSAKPTTSEPIQVAVTPELLGVVQATTGAFKNVNSDIEIELTTDESADAITRLFSRTIDVAVIGRPLSAAELTRAKELKLGLRTEALGWDGIGVWVHPSIARSMPSISLETLKKIFVSGEINRWEQIAPGKLQGRILPVTPPVRSGVVEVFLNSVGQRDGSLHKQVSVINEAMNIPANVLQNKLRIGLAPAMLHANGLAKMSLEVSGHELRCAESELRTGSYPLPLYVTAVTLTSAEPQGNDYYRYLSSVEGQQSLYAAGLTTALLAPPTPEAIPYDPHAAAGGAHGGGHGGEQASGHGGGHDEAKETSKASGHH